MAIPVDRPTFIPFLRVRVHVCRVIMSPYRDKLSNETRRTKIIPVSPPRCPTPGGYYTY